MNPLLILLVVMLVLVVIEIYFDNFDILKRHLGVVSGLIGLAMFNMMALVLPTTMLLLSTLPVGNVPVDGKELTKFGVIAVISERDHFVRDRRGKKERGDKKCENFKSTQVLDEKTRALG